MTIVEEIAAKLKNVDRDQATVWSKSKSCSSYELFQVVICSNRQGRGMKSLAMKASKIGVFAET